MSEFLLVHRLGAPHWGMYVLRITQRSLQFIRWVRDSLHAKTPWRPAVEQLRPLMTAYLQ